MAKPILSVSYDEPLLRTREMLLQRQGYSVTSALGFTDAIEQCKTARFDLFILGHSIPDADKRELMNVFRGRCDAPVLAFAATRRRSPERGGCSQLSGRHPGVT